MLNQSPFEKKSAKTARSPVRASERIRIRSEPSEVNTRERATTELISQRTQTKEQTGTQTTRPTSITSMNQQQIQTNIASFVPEFSGDDTPHRANELTRFIGTADSIYETLRTDEERKTFSKLIKFRLTGDAYMRVTHRNIKDYTELRDALNSMYAKTYSLDELERNWTTTTQTYGETIRNYGYRLLEALERYKTAFRIKYKQENIDLTYESHLNTVAVQAFKRGLNNIILREKIATVRANNVDSIIDETEAIESMIVGATCTTSLPCFDQQQTLPQTMPKYTRPQRSQTVICNYCQKPNHTWDVCRTRTNQEILEKSIQTQQRNYNRTNPLPNAYSQRYAPNIQTNQQIQSHYDTRNQAPTYGQQPLPTPRNFANYRRNNYNPQQQQNQFTPPTQQPQYIPTQRRSSYAPKYCAHCKTTTGHTFEECRSKFFAKPQSHRPNQNNPPTPPDANALTDTFNKMRINTIYPHQPQNEDAQYIHPENFKGSDQI